MDSQQHPSSLPISLSTSFSSMPSSEATHARGVPTRSGAGIGGERGRGSGALDQRLRYTHLACVLGVSRRLAAERAREGASRELLWVSCVRRPRMQLPACRALRTLLNARADANGINRDRWRASSCQCLVIAMEKGSPAQSAWKRLTPFPLVHTGFTLKKLLCLRGGRRLFPAL